MRQTIARIVVKQINETSELLSSPPRSSAAPNAPGPAAASLGARAFARMIPYAMAIGLGIGFVARELLARAGVDDGFALAGMLNLIARSVVALFAIAALSVSTIFLGALGRARYTAELACIGISSVGAAILACAVSPEAVADFMAAGSIASMRQIVLTSALPGLLIPVYGGLVAAIGLLLAVCVRPIVVAFAFRRASPVPGADKALWFGIVVLLAAVALSGALWWREFQRLPDRGSILLAASAGTARRHIMMSGFTPPVSPGTLPIAWSALGVETRYATVDGGVVVLVSSPAADKRPQLQLLAKADSGLVPFVHGSHIVVMELSTGDAGSGDRADEIDLAEEAAELTAAAIRLRWTPGRAGPVNVVFVSAPSRPRGRLRRTSRGL